MKATELLKHEHQVILLVLDAAEREAKRIDATGEMRKGRVEDMVDLFHNFADRCHHAKEEDYLFVRMGERDPEARSGPIAAMLSEHEEARARVKAMGDALPRAAQGNAHAQSVISRNLLAYVKLLRSHIDQEDTVVYPIADQILTAEDQERLSEDFDRVEAEEMGEGVHERYHTLAHELAEDAAD